MSHGAASPDQAPSTIAIRDADLEPSWDLKQAREPGFLRSLTTWVGGPEGYINSNPAASAKSNRSAVGLMRMPVGNRQPGVHVHSVTEIYIILRGEVESFDGQGRTHRAGPLDCLYIPAGVPHGVRAIGTEDLELVWVHDAIERIGVSTYFDDDAAPETSDAEVVLVTFDALAATDGASPHDAPHVLEWVRAPARLKAAGPGAVSSDLVAVGIASVPPGTPWRTDPDAGTYVVLEGAASLAVEGQTLTLGPLDAVYCRTARPCVITNIGSAPLRIMSVLEIGAGPAHA